MNKPYISGIQEDKLEIEVMENTEKCELGELNLHVGGEIDETVSFEDKLVADEGGEEAVLELPKATEVIDQTEDVAKADEGVGEVSDARSADQSLMESQEEELNPPAGTVVIDTWDAQMEPGKKAEEELEPVVEGKEEAFVTDTCDAQQFSSEMLMDSRGDELVEEGMEAGNGKFEMEIAVGDRVDEVIGVDIEFVQSLMAVGEKIEEMGGADIELVQSLMAVGEKIEEMGGADIELVQSLMVENESEMAVGGDDDDGDKVDAAVNNSDDVNAENPAAIEEETVDPVITEEIQSSEVKSEVDLITEFSEDVVDASEQKKVLRLSDERGDLSADVSYEHAENKNVADEAILISETKMVDDNKGEEVLKKPLLDEPVNVAEDREEAVAEEHDLAVDAKMEMEAGVEGKSGDNDMAEDTQLADAEPKTETGNEMVADKTRSELDGIGREMDDLADAPPDEEDEIMSAGKETGTQDTEMETGTQDTEMETGTQDTEIETETDVNESSKASGGKRKRGNFPKSPSISKPTAKSSSKKTVGEDVCFICFDGGDLFLCDRRGCPKAYHPSCVDRDEAFFKAKGRWNCGWHMCSICEKTARYMCYTCTFSLCRSCIKDAVILCVRGNKGFCENCVRTVTLIENNEQENKDTQVDFDDKSSWEYLFKDYYLELKAKLSLSAVEITKAKNPWKGADVSASRKHESSGAQPDANDGGSGSDDSTEKSETIKPKKRRLRKQSKPLIKKEKSSRRNVVARDEGTSMSDISEWASKELLEFVSHMNDGDTPMLSQFDVQALLLEYIKRNKLRDPRRKSQIKCDSRLENLFGKPRVGHFEMLKLLESHFISRDEQNDDVQGSVVDTENNQLDDDDDTDDLLTKSKRRKTRRKYDVRQSNLDDYAAIDMHNISLIYLRRKLMEDLLEDSECFHEKAVGTFVRIRISGSTQKQDLYRLVQVVGTSKVEEPYKVGKKTTDIMVEILNLDKTEVIPMDTVSNQEFTEEECKRLRQSIKCGLISRLTVGEILDKTMEIQVARVNDWLESEVSRLSHLRDRASDLGRRKELRECVEKLQLLKTPEERRRRLDEIPKIHEDPKMDPSYESDDNESESEENRKDAFMRSKGFSRRGRGPISPRTDSSTKDSWSGSTQFSNKIWEPSRNHSSINFSPNAIHASEMVNETSRNLEDKFTQESHNIKNLNPVTNSDLAERMVRTVSRSESFSAVSVTPQVSLPAVAEETYVKINESEKMWHYKDPSGKEQGPFSMVQLRKWNNTGYFPTGLKIWRKTENHDNSISLSDALAGKFPKESPASKNILQATDNLHSSSRTPLHSDMEKQSADQKWARKDITSLPSPTPNAGMTGGEGGFLTGAIQSPSHNGLFTSNATLPNIMTHSATPASVLNSVGVPYSPTPNSQKGADSMQHQPTVTGEPHAGHLNILQPGTIQAVQTIINNQNLQPDTQGWSSWVASNVPNSSGTSSNAGASTVTQPDSWGPTQSSQPSMPYNMGTANPNAGRGPVQANPNMGWINPVAGNTNMNWVPVMPVSNATGGWVGGPSMQGPVSGNVNNSGWGQAQVWGGPPVQNGWVPPSGNSGATVQGSVTGNGWVPSVGAPPQQGNGNQGWELWSGEQNNIVGPFMGGQGRDSGFGGGVGGPWNNRQSGGGGYSKRNTVCPYNANGRCRKGSRCDYKHV